MSIKEIENGLRRRVGTENLIGCFCKKEGKSFFNDIRGGEGDVVDNSTIKDPNFAIEYNGEKSLTVGEFYSFNWHLEDVATMTIVLDGEPQEIDKAEFVKGIFDARLALRGSNLELANSIQRTIFNEVTGAQHTYIYELLQNANDYPYKDEHVSVKFILTEHYLFFLHSGDFFNLRNIVGISSINQGEKRSNTKTIGYKGIGFKTVFVNNEYVYLRSGEWSLRFDREYSDKEFLGSSPWALMPIPTGQSEIELEAKSVLDSNPMRVQFALRHKTDARLNQPQLKKVFSNDRILLFIPNVYNVDIIIDGEPTRHIVKDEEKWLVETLQYPIPEPLKQWVEDNINAGDKIPEKFKEIQDVGISFAVTKDGDRLIPVDNAVVYNYLPTELRLGLKFLVNSNFVPNANRAGLHDVVWNDHIMERCGMKFAEWWSSLMQEEGKYQLSSVFDILPDSLSSNDKYTKLFLDGFKKRIQEIPCIPTLRDGYHLETIKNTLYDTTGIMTASSPVFTDDEFYLFSDTNGCLPHPQIRCHQNLILLLNELETQFKFNGVGLEELCGDEDFFSWLHDASNNIKFLSFLIENDFLNNLIEREIFLKEDKSVGKASKMYYNIDNVIDDINFLASDLPRLNIAVRDSLDQSFGLDTRWTGQKQRFKRFEPFQFANNILSNVNKYISLLKNQSNSVRFIHFLAITNYLTKLPETFPLITEDGSIKVGSYEGLFLSDEEGKRIASRKWINKDWIRFIAPEYFETDADKVSSFLRDKAGISELTTSRFLRSYVGDESHAAVISSNIKNTTNSVDFYLFLADSQDVFTRWSNSIRKIYTILTTDGKTNQWAPVSSIVFWNDNDWKQAANQPWMPEGMCLSVSSIYFDGQNEETKTKLTEFFKQQQIVYSYSIAGFSQLLFTRFANITQKLTTKELSRGFLDFLFENRNQLFKDENNYAFCASIPVFCKGHNTSTPLSSSVYQISQDLLNLYNQPWFNQSELLVCDEVYESLFDGNDRKLFFEKIGLIRFVLIDYIREKLLPNLSKLKDALSNFENNKSFHHYFVSISNHLTEDDCKLLKSTPIFISTPSGVPESVDYSNDHYLPSELLTEIISQDLVPISIMDTIHPDYIRNDNDRQYLEDKLGNVEIGDEGFFKYIKIQEEESVPYLKEDKKRNIRFWRRVVKQNLSTETLKELSTFPILGRATDEDSDQFHSSSELYISGLYSELDGIEEFVSKYVTDPIFVSSSYKTEDDDDWEKMFKAIGITVDFRRIIKSKILPNLGEFKSEAIVKILSKYNKEIQNRLNDEEDSLKEQLESLQLLCVDGSYRSAANAVVAGRYFSYNENPLPAIAIDNLVSEQYIENASSDEDRRQIISFIKIIADNISEAKCEDATQLRDFKFNSFIVAQETYASIEDHFAIVAQIATAYFSDIEGFGKLVEASTILLKSTKGELSQPAQLYLSSAYTPDCDYMGHGITTLAYVSEQYHDQSSDISKFFKKIGVRHTFNSANLELLKKRNFAIYFWETYAPSHEHQLIQICTEDNLRDLQCMPTVSGICKPIELYDYRLNDLVKIVESLGIKDQRMPAVKLPDWMSDKKVGFRPYLFFADCIDYLKLNNINYRRAVINWITSTPDDVISNKSHLIDEYLESALWLNGKKQWVPLKDLVALEFDNETLKDNFSGNVAVCNPSYMPEVKTDYNKLCRIFKIRVLTNDDFQKEKVGDFFTEHEFITEVRKKLIYLAWKSSKKEEWKERLNRYFDILDNADISSCEEISYFFDDTIKTDLQAYTESADSLWYVGAWNGPMFLEILNWIKTKIISSSEFDHHFLQNLFLKDFTAFIEKHEAGSLPNEVLELLSDADRNAIREDQFAQAAEFNENDISNSKLPDGVREASESHVYEQESEDESEAIEEQDVSVEGGQNAPAENNPAVANAKSNVDTQTSSRSSETSSAGTKSTNNSNSSSSRSRERQSSSAKTESRSDNTSSNKKKSALERFRDELNLERQRTVKRPHSSGMAPGEYFDIPDSSKTNEETDQGDTFFKPSGSPAPTRQDNSTWDNTRMQDTFKRRDAEAQNAAQEAADNFDLFDALKNAPKYSFFWFELLIRLQTDKEKQKESRRTCEIYFKDYQIIAEKEDKVNIKLSNTASLIPSWIEYADSTELSCIKSNTVLFKAGIIGHDEMSIDIQVNSQDVQLFKDTKKICVRAENRTNFVDSLRTRFTQLEYDEDYNLADNLPEDIQFVYGPPGTGKTTRLVELLHEIVEASGDDRINILVLTPTNKAADVIAKKIAFDEKCSHYLSRFGYSEDKYLIEDFPVVMTRDTMEIDFFEKNIMVATAARFAYDCIQPDDTAICDFNWDYIVIDEASMIDLVTITYVLHKAKSSKFIIAGDPKQIQPFEDKNNFAENIYHMVGLNEFKDAMHYERYKVETLDVQHRSTPIIGNIVSQFAYNGLLKNDPERNPQKPMTIDGIETNDINFVGFKIEELDRLYGRNAINNSAFHLYSAIFTYNMVDYVTKQLEKNNPEIDYSIGIVCPYGAQAAAISQLIDNRPLDNKNCSVHYGTVHRFQGDECDIMFVILNPPQIVSQGTHINNQNIVNVAMSRARDYLFFVLPEKPIQGFETRETLGGLIDEEHRAILHCSDIEKTIFGNEKYIFENTNVLTHLPVNVYYNTHAKYEVRIDDNTLDIQIND